MRRCPYARLPSHKIKRWCELVRGRYAAPNQLAPPADNPCAGSALARRLDILIQVEHILRIVPGLDRGQPLVVRAVGGTHAPALVLAHEVDVGARPGERPGLRPERARPGLVRLG